MMRDMYETGKILCNGTYVERRYVALWERCKPVPDSHMVCKG